MRRPLALLLVTASALAIAACSGGAKTSADAQAALSVTSTSGSAGGVAAGGTGASPLASDAAASGGDASHAAPSSAAGAGSTGPGSTDPSTVASPAGSISGRPLAGKVIVLDPGHQYGSQFHLRQINKKVDAGGFKKACNTTGTATDSGYPESAFTMAVANYTKKKLEALGAKVYLTRPRESSSLWGPCIDARGRAGGKYNADAVVSIHGDGEPAGLHGFFVIRPALKMGWTDDIFASSKKLATAIHSGLRAAGLANANYVGGDGYDVRGDLGTLNWESKPVVMIEMGNMRNGTDAQHMKAARWQRDVYAQGIVNGLVTFLG